MGLGAGFPTYEPGETIPDYSPESHMYSEGMNELEASYPHPNHVDYEVEEADSDRNIKATGIINKLTP